MSYVAKSLEDIAVLFADRAADHERHAANPSYKRSVRDFDAGAANAWAAAADILRRTTITEPVHMEAA